MAFTSQSRGLPGRQASATGKKSDVREFLFHKKRVGRLNCAERQAQR